MKEKIKIGIIGYGNMGSAIAQRIESEYRVWVFDKDVNKTKNLSGIEVASDSIDLVKKTEVIILAVKPQDFQAVLNEIRDHVREKLIISIAAGITTRYIEKVLGKVRVVRVMPNIGVKIGQAESSLCKGRYSQDDDLNLTWELFNQVGQTWVIEEKLMNAATAISGSGPAYIYYDLENNSTIDPLHVPVYKQNQYKEYLTKAAEKLGFDSSTASDLAGCVTGTSLALLAATRESPEKLRIMVTSPGGTTQAALEVLRAGGLWEDAALAAKKRAAELSKS